ncbi:uncharacterized protein METZ01_LOCUS169641, partial [marine metagenome]
MSENKNTIHNHTHSDDHAHSQLPSD